jgi:2-(1,2-epoxy-1,2-dihydrophenyl)acetyl-CoA isomerase
MTIGNNPAVLSHREGGLAHIIFNRPGTMNAIDGELAQEFLSACEAAGSDEDVRVIVISGKGRAFSAGGDLKKLREEPVNSAEALIEPMHAAIGLLTELDVPVLASLHGAVAGAGLSLAIACDLAIAAEGTLLNLAYVNVGVSCDVGASWHLPRLVGLRRALEIALLSETIDANEALRLGLVNRVVPQLSLKAETLKFAERLAAGSPIAMGHLKRLMRESFSHDLREQLAAESAAFKACAASADFSEAVGAFFEKRVPVYRGS